MAWNNSDQNTKELFINQPSHRDVVQKISNDMEGMEVNGNLFTGLRCK